MQLSQKALEYKHKIDDAKTGLKKDFYKKKLEKVNQQAYAVLAKMSMFDNSKVTKHEPVVTQEETTEEKTDDEI
jgi:hypothetical protein